MKQARKLQATLVQNYDRLTDSLTGVKCRATSVAKKLFMHMFGFERTLVELSDDHILCAWEISKRSKLSIP